MTFVLPDVAHASFDPTTFVGQLMAAPLEIMAVALRAQDDLVQAWLALFGIGVVATVRNEPGPAARARIAPPPTVKAKRPQRASSVDPAGVFDDNAVVKVAPKLLTKSKGKGDDLLAIKGIGPKLGRLLNDLGVHHYRQIAEWTPGEIAWINDKLDFKGRVQREKWVAQARALVKGR